MFIFQIPTGGPTTTPIRPAQTSGGTPPPTLVPTGGPTTQQPALPVLPIPTGGPTTQEQVPNPSGERISPPPDIRDAINQGLSGMRRNEALIAQEGLRRGTPIATIMGQLGATFQEGGHYRLPSGRNVYYQWSRFLYSPLSDSSGLILIPRPPSSDGRPVAPSEMPVSHGLLFSARVIAAQNLVPNFNGSYTFVRGNRPDEQQRNTAVHSLMPDGRVFRAAGRENGVDVPAGIFSPDGNGGIRFEESTSERPVTEMPGTNLIRDRSLRQTGTPRLFIHPNPNGNPYPVYILPDGRLLYVRATLQNDSGDVQTSDTGIGTWPHAGRLTDAAITGNADIQRGIAAIAAYRGVPTTPPPARIPPTLAPQPTATSLDQTQALAQLGIFNNQCINYRIPLKRRRSDDSTHTEYNQLSPPTYYMLCMYASRTRDLNQTSFLDQAVELLYARRGEPRTKSGIRELLGDAPLVPAHTLNPNEYYAFLLEEFLLTSNSTLQTTVVTNLPTNTTSFSERNNSTDVLPNINNLIHTFTTDGGLNPTQAALINRRIRQFAHLCRNGQLYGNEWNTASVQEIVAGIVTDPELGFTTERGRAAMVRVLRMVHVAFNTWWTNQSTASRAIEGIEALTEQELNQITTRGRDMRTRGEWVAITNP